MENGSKGRFDCLKNPADAERRRCPAGVYERKTKTRWSYLRGDPIREVGGVGLLPALCRRRTACRRNVLRSRRKTTVSSLPGAVVERHTVDRSGSHVNGSDSTKGWRREAQHSIPSQPPPPLHGSFPGTAVNIHFTADDLILPLKHIKGDTKENFTQGNKAE